MQTGQPGPMMTCRSFGKAVRSPYRAIACSWLPQTCMTDTGERPISATVRWSFAASAAARAGSRNFSSRASSLLTRRLDFAANVPCHQVLRVGLAQQLFVHPQRAFDIVFGDPPDRVADVVEDVVTRLHRLVAAPEPHATRDAEEVDDGFVIVDFEDPAGNAKTHHRLLARAARAR